MGRLLIRKNQTDYVALFFALVVLFGVAVFAVILYNAYDENIKGKLDDALVASTPVDSNANVTKILDQTSGGIRKLNPLFPLLLVGVFGYVMMLALASRSHPAFFFIGLIILGVALIMAAAFTNVFEGITSNSNFESSSEDLNIISAIMGNLPLTIFIIFIAIAIILYVFPSKPVGGSI